MKIKTILSTAGHVAAGGAVAYMAQSQGHPDLAWTSVVAFGLKYLASLIPHAPQE